jgi:hypothetical protein
VFDDFLNREINRFNGVGRIFVLLDPQPVRNFGSPRSFWPSKRIASAK